MKKQHLLGIAPIISSIAWISTIVALLILWLTHGRPKYKAASATITYISNVGAHYKTLFIVGTCTTAFFFIVTLVEFLMFHRYIYKKNNGVANGNNGVANGNGNRRGVKRTWADIVAFILGVISVSCLVLLSIFDSINHEAIHWVFTLIFAFAAIMCAVFNLVAVSVSRHVSKGKMASFILKILFILFSTAILVAMIILMYSCSATAQGTLSASCNNVKSVAAILEWSLALLFFIFTITWAIDFTA